MKKTTENYIEHEVRIRFLEETMKDVKTLLTSMDSKMDNQFK